MLWLRDLVAEASKKQDNPRLTDHRLARGRRWYRRLQK
jgi:hypothetical protein